MSDVEPLTAEEILAVRHFIANRRKVVLGILTVIGLGLGNAIWAAITGLA